MTSWLTPDDADLPDLWPGSQDFISTDALAAYLDAARVQCEAFAPRLQDGADVPHAYRLAQALQARALARAPLVGSGDHDGGYGDTVTVFPMDWTVKNLLRPQHGRMVIA